MTAVMVAVLDAGEAGNVVTNPQLIEEMRWQLKQIEDRRAENQRLLAGIDADRIVTVLAGPGGAVSEVRLAPEAMRLDAVTLGQAITAAIREAAGAGPQPLRSAPQPQRGPLAPQRRRTDVEDGEPYDTVFDV